MPFVHCPAFSLPFDQPPIVAEADRTGRWFLLSRSGDLAILDPDGDPIRQVPLDLSRLATEGGLVLKVSPDGGLAAVAEEFGTQGGVYSLISGALVHSLERADYHAEHCSFPLAFVERGGQRLLVHGTDWNRLDVIHVDTGVLLTDRAPTSYTREENRPEHYLDYFHGRLHVSPSGERVAEDGWIWHPFGIPRAWSLDAWLGGNVWESEDGPSLRHFPERLYFWDGPMTWIDDRRLAIWGLGDDDENLEPGIRIYDAVDGEETVAFAGPSIAPHRIWPPTSGARGWIAAARWLYAISPESGTSVWDYERGVLLHQEDDFLPHGHHRESDRLISWRGSEVILSHFVQ